MTDSRRHWGLRSVRVRLMVWNVCIVALVLAAMGALTSYTVRVKLMNAVERDLRERADRVHPPPDRRDGPGDNGGPGEGPDHQPPPPRDPDGSISVRMPRVFTIKGEGRPPFQTLPVWDQDAFVQSAAGREVEKTITLDGEPARLLSRPQWPGRGGPPEPGHPSPPEEENGAPPRPGERPMGVIQVIYPLAEIHRSVGEVNAALLALIPVALLLAGAGGAWLTDRALRPVREIAQTAARIGADDLERRLPLSGGDEFEELSGTINGMLERLQASFGRLETIVQQQRRFTADASHELKTPLTVIKANSSLTLATRTDLAGYHEAVEEIDRAANSMGRLVQDLLTLASADEDRSGRERETILAGNLLRDSAVQCRIAGKAAVVCARIDESATIHVNPEELKRVLANLIDNALRYTPADGRVTLSCITEAGMVRLRVEDTGTGISPEHIEHLGERFYRVDDSRTRSEGGSGLGLSICKSLVEANGGALQIESEIGKGTIVTVILPDVAEAPPTPLKQADPRSV